MLLSRGFQPPRKYTIPEPDPLASPITTPCAVCTSKAWTAELYTKLKTATNDVKSSVHRYTLTSNELREMVIRGCQFCRSLADGIHGQIFLDELYARFEAQEVNSSGEDEDILGETSGENNQDEEEWNDASAFNEDDIDDDVTGGWDTWQDRDTLSENRKMNVEMSFEQGDEGIFTFLNVYIRTAEDEHRGTGKLGLLEDESIVSLRYHTNQKVELDHKLFPVTKAGVALGAEQHLQAIASWAESLQHGIAKEKLTQGQMPARLIDIGQAGSLTIVDTSTIRPPPKFAALSYVWGTNQSFVLTNKSIAVLQIHFQAQQLPQTIQDAITVATRAGLKYIWIDALCIIQDSPTDKAIELPKMQHIYKDACITIIASIAPAATAGFLTRTTEPKYFIDPISTILPSSTPNAPNIDVILSYPSSYDRTLDPINTRAWTFQELILADRAILFSYRGMSFLNRTKPPKANGETSGRDPQLPNLPWNSDFFSLAQPRENIRSIWLSLRGEYSRRNLTVQGDKLLAISGLAMEVSKSYESRYLAGMWERDLISDLQWRCLKTDNPVRKRRSIFYVAPSWSWASVDAVVDGAEFDAGEDMSDDGHARRSNTLDFEVVSCGVELVNQNFEFGAVRSGTLVVKGRGHVLLWRPFSESDRIAGDTDGDIVAKGHDESDVVLGQAYLDALEDDLVDGSEVFCLAMTITGRQKDCVGLMLLPVDDEKWRRVGFFETKWQEVFDDCDVEQYIIV